MSNSVTRRRVYALFYWTIVYILLIPAMTGLALGTIVVLILAVAALLLLLPALLILLVLALPLSLWSYWMEPPFEKTKRESQDAVFIPSDEL
jgi:hypothetical protein